MSFEQFSMVPPKEDRPGVRRSLIDIAKYSETRAREQPLTPQEFDLIDAGSAGELAAEVGPIVAKAEEIGLQKFGAVYKDAKAREYAASLAREFEPGRRLSESESYWWKISERYRAKIETAHARGYLLGAKGVSRSKK